MANIVILGVKVLYTSGGQEILVRDLQRELKNRGHKVELVEIPYAPLPKEGILTQAAYWRSIDFNGSSKTDLLIATKFPNYFAKHIPKSVWLVHQHRNIYDLFGTRFSDFSDDPRDEELRKSIQRADQKCLAEADYLSGISGNVVERLKQYNNLDADILYPPLPQGDNYRQEKSEDYILSVGRLCGIKRVDMMIKALPIVHKHIKLKIVGTPDEPSIMDYFQNEISKHHLEDRIEFLGRVSNEDLIDLFAKARAVYYAPYQEDYGYVTLEAMASAKPVIAAKDSGGVLEFVRHEENGLVVDPNSDSVGPVSYTHLTLPTTPYV